MAIIRVPADKPTIQDAVNSARGLDVILVSDGVYHEEVTTFGILKLVADGNEVILDGRGILQNAFTINSDLGFHMRGFKIRNYVNAGIVVTFSTVGSFISNQIEHVGGNGIEIIEGNKNLVWRNKIEQIGGVGIRTESNQFFIENEIRHTAGEGMQIDDGSLVILNHIEHAVGHGIQVTGPGGGGAILSNQILNNRGHGIILQNTSTVLISNNEIRGSRIDGVHIEGSDVTIQQNVIEQNSGNGIVLNRFHNAVIQNTFRNNGLFDIVDNGTNSSFAGNDCTSSSLPNICREPFINVIRVPADQPTIQAAVDAAVQSAVILVSDGVYREEVKIDTFQKGFLRILAEGDQPILDGEGIRSSAFDLTNTGFVMIRGFTIRDYTKDGIVADNNSLGIAVIDNNIERVGGNGIAGAALVWRNMVARAGGTGIDSGVILNNTIRRSGINGIQSGDIAWVNTVKASAGNGIAATNFIIQNEIMDNQGNGMTDKGISSGRLINPQFFGNVIADNVISSNGGGGIITTITGRLVIIEDNMISNNSHNGMELPFGGALIYRNLMKQNQPFDILDTNPHFVDNTCETSMPEGLCVRKIRSVIQVPKDQPTIQAAVDAAKSGDIILVADGIYHEAVEVDKSLIRIIAESDRVILDGRGKLANAFSIFPALFGVTSSTTNIEIKGFTIRNYCNDAILIVNCFENMVTQNTIQQIGGNGIELLSAADNFIWGNSIVKCGRDGIRDLGVNNLIVENRIALNKGRGIASEIEERVGRNPTGGLILRNHISKNDGDGIFIGDDSDFMIIENNTVRENAGSGLRLLGDSNGVIRNDFMRNFGMDIVDQGLNNHYLDNPCRSSKPSSICAEKRVSIIEVPRDFPTIQAAVDAASPGDVILVAEGVYHEEVRIATNFIRIIAANDRVILDGNGLLANAFFLNKVEFFTIVIFGVEISGFTIRNYASHGIAVDTGDSHIIKDNTIENVGGRGIELISTFQHVMDRNQILSCTSDGIHSDSSSSNHLIIENLVRDNGGKGIFAEGSVESISGYLIARNKIENNVDGGILVNGTFDILEQNQVLNNSNNGIVLDALNVSLIRNILTGNTPFDIQDISNAYIRNSCEKSDPEGICGGDC